MWIKKGENMELNEIKNELKEYLNKVNELWGLL